MFFLLRANVMPSGGCWLLCVSSTAGWVGGRCSWQAWKKDRCGSLVWQEFDKLDVWQPTIIFMDLHGLFVTNASVFKLQQMVNNAGPM